MERVNALGVCAYRSACDHRILRHEAEMGRLNAALALNDPLPCGHTGSDHAFMVGMRDGLASVDIRGTIDDLLRSLREGYEPE